MIVTLERDECVDGGFVKIGCVAQAIARAKGSSNPRDTERKLFQRVNSGVQRGHLNPLDPEDLRPLSHDDYGNGIVPFAELVTWGHSTKLFEFRHAFLFDDGAVQTIPIANGSADVVDGDAREAKYGAEDAQCIINEYLNEFIEVRSDGLHLKDVEPETESTQLFHWTPACEMDWPGAPNALTAPSLPFPFSAAELAAFLLHGVGVKVASIYGNLDWEQGPDDGMLNGLGIKGREPRKALLTAYAAFREAVKIVGPFDAKLQKRADDLNAALDQANLDANDSEGVFEENKSESQKRASRERARESIARLLAQADRAQAEATADHGTWRKAMVTLLLHPRASLPATDCLANIKATPESLTGVQAVSPVANMLGSDMSNSTQEVGRHFNSTKPKFRDALWSVIEEAQFSCRDRHDTAEVWAKLQVLAENKTPPLRGTTEDGLQYLRAGEVAILSRDALHKRLHRKPRKATGKLP